MKIQNLFAVSLLTLFALGYSASYAKADAQDPVSCDIMAYPNDEDIMAYPNDEDIMCYPNDE